MTLKVRILKRRGTFTLDLSFLAEPGFTVLFGPSGSGKSTLLSCLSGLLEPDDGEVILGERVLFRAGGRPVPPEARRIGYLPQDTLLFPHLTIEQNLDFAYPSRPTAEQQARRESLIESLGLAPLLKRSSRDVSGGEAQRASLARALLRFPELLLADEPTSSLDRGTKESALADLRRVGEALSIPILYVTHSASEVLALANRVLILKNGRLIREGGPELAFDPVAGGTDSVEALNFLEGRVLSVGGEKGPTTVQWAGQTLRAGPLGLPVGSAVTLAVSPHDILLARESPGVTSARNHLRAKVAAMAVSDGQVLVQFGQDQPLFVTVTPEARDELGLKPGREVHLLLKSTALRRV